MRFWNSELGARFLMYVTWGTLASQLHGHSIPWMYRHGALEYRALCLGWAVGAIVNAFTGSRRPRTEFIYPLYTFFESSCSSLC
jgi:hypothetical protein